MKKLVRHKWLVLTVAAVVMLTGTVYLQVAQHGTAMATPIGGPYDVATPYERDQLHLLCDDLALDRDALVALNLSAQQAETLLSTVRTWRQNNEPTLQARKNDIDNAVLALRQIEKTIAVGPADAQHADTLSARREALSDARTAYDTALDSLRTAVNEILSQSQRDTWTAIRSGHGQRMPIRMLDLNETQRVAMGKAWQRYRMQYQAADSAQAREAAVSTWETAQSSILTQAQQTVVAAYHENYDTASANVAAAFATVLPRDEG